MGNRERELAIEAHADDIPWTQGGDVAQKTKQYQIDSILFTDSNGQGVGNQRLEEQRIGMAILGMTKLYPIGYQRKFEDGNLPNIPIGQLVQALLYVVDAAEAEGFPYTRFRVFGRKGFSGHKDHIKIAEATEIAFDLRPKIQTLTTVEMTPEEHALWPKDYFVHVPTPDISGCMPIDISSTRHLKVAAIEAHTSQLQNGGFEQMERVAILPPRELYRYTVRP